MPKPRGAGAVMADRAPDEVEEDTPQMRLYRRLNYFPTPPWAARAGAELLLHLDPSARSVAEPACGEMHMAAAMEGYFADVRPSDIHPFSPKTPIRDWLDDDAWAEDEVDWIMTNPPFALAEDFIRRGLRRARTGVAILVRLSFMESDGRYDLHCNPVAPLTLYAPFVERVPMFLGRYLPKKSSATAYAWLFYMKGHPDPGRFKLIAPGTKARLLRPADIDRFAYRKPLPLLGLQEGEA
jgi:hypothetical protein